MDWEPTSTTQINRTKTTTKPTNDYAKSINGKVLRAKWVSKEELEERKKKGYCFCCGGNNHMVANCKFAPAVNPKVKINTITTTPMVEEILDEPSDDKTKAPKA